jgi:hypothetical protein
MLDTNRLPGALPGKCLLQMIFSNLFGGFNKPALFLPPLFFFFIIVTKMMA